MAAFWNEFFIRATAMFLVLIVILIIVHVILKMNNALITITLNGTSTPDNSNQNNAPAQGFDPFGAGTNFYLP